MKKIYSIVILFLATFGIAYSSSLNTEGSDFVTEVIIVRDLPARANPHAPEKNPTVFQAYAIGTSNCLVIYSNKTVNTLISVENQTTGDCSDYTVSISTSPITIDLFGSGVYHLTLQLSDGKTYYGDFEIWEPVFLKGLFLRLSLSPFYGEGILRLKRLLLCSPSAIALL